MALHGFSRVDAEMRDPSRWYRVAGSRCYHHARSDFVRSGLAVCGADIRRAGWSATSAELRAFKVARVRACERCLRSLRLS